VRAWAGRRVVVTGAARGIGRVTAAKLAQEGMIVVLVDRDGPLAASEAVAIGRGATGRALDVADREAFAALIADIEAREGPVDALINNAGIMPIGAFTEQDPLLDDRQIDVNLRGVVHGCRAVLPGMIGRRRGHIVNIASVAGRVGVPFAAVYSATKHAVIGLSESRRPQLAPAGVEIGYVVPSLVRTELISGTGVPRFPPPIAPERVADAVWRVLATGAVDVYVPSIGRLGQVLPALVPRRVYEAVGRLFGIDRMFAHSDAHARQAYASRMAESALPRA
jgi:short-subunit dehydrogenase